MTSGINISDSNTTLTATNVYMDVLNQGVLISGSHQHAQFIDNTIHVSNALGTGMHISGYGHTILVKNSTLAAANPLYLKNI